MVYCTSRIASFLEKWRKEEEREREERGEEREGRRGRRGESRVDRRGDE